MKKILLKLMALLAVFVMCSNACEQQVSPQNPPVEQPGDVEQPGETEDNSTSIKVLAIGNSFSVDAIEYLYGVLVDLGYEEIVLGNLYIDVLLRLTLLISRIIVLATLIISIPLELGIRLLPINQWMH